jgi:hypothetical protein
MLRVLLREDRILIGERFSVGFQRTLRIPDDGRLYPLPPGLGPFPVHRLDDYPDGIPTSWQGRDDYLIPLYQREALWIGFGGASWKPNAVKVGVGRVNAVSGLPWDEELHDDPQDYLVCPKQLWLDGINAGDGYVRQFVAMPLGSGYTIEAQVAGAEELGGIQILVFEPRPGRFPDAPPQTEMIRPAALPSAAGLHSPRELGLAAGGKIKQKIYPDSYGLSTWDTGNRGSALVHLVNSEQFTAWTGRRPPLTPISARTYIERGFPWFDLYDEDEGDVARPDQLAGVKSLREIDSQGGVSSTDDEGKDVPETAIKRIPRDEGS